MPSCQCFKPCMYESMGMVHKKMGCICFWGIYSPLLSLDTIFALSKIERLGIMNGLDNKINVNALTQNANKLTA